MVHRKKTWWHDRSSDSAAILFLKNKNKNLLLWSGWTDRGKTLQVWPPICEEQNVHTYDVTSHMVWQPYLIYPYTCKNTPLNGSPGEGLQSPLALCLVSVCLFWPFFFIVILLFCLTHSWVQVGVLREYALCTQSHGRGGILIAANLPPVSFNFPEERLQWTT